MIGIFSMIIEGTSGTRIMIANEFPKRYFLINNGRSGSSLLAAVLADAGADFGMEAPQSWDPRTGQMENRSAERASRHYRRAWDIDHGRRYKLLPEYEARFRRRRGRRWLRQALGEAEYFKIGNLDLLIQPSFRLGYLPQMILIFRRFEPNLASLLAGLTHVGPDDLAKDYLRIYRQGLVYIHCFGGCAIAYEHLVDPNDERWASALSHVTGLPESALLGARAARVCKHVPESHTDTIVYPEVADLYTIMESLAGTNVAPGGATLREMRMRLQPQ